jgi:hypothetical protein
LLIILRGQGENWRVSYKYALLKIFGAQLITPVAQAGGEVTAKGRPENPAENVEAGN